MVHELLRAGMSAPSAEDERPWHFIVVTDPELRGRMQVHHPDIHILTHAPVSIVVCGDLARQKAHGFWVQDCAAATENLLIEAQILGLGAVWLGIHPVEGRVQSFRGFFNIPETIVPFSIVAVGFPDEKKGPADRYDHTRIHFQNWNNQQMNDPTKGQE